ncbi:NLR family CARD domain-containing protein 3-like [Styela clava]
MGVGWIREYPERFLLVLDGADQYSSPESLGIPHGKCNHKEEADPKLILNLILAGKLYSGIRILYSSREHVIRNFKGVARPERIIALAGFSEEDVMKLVKAFSGDKSAYVMNRLQNEAKAIFSLCSIPMFLIFTVSVLIIYEQYSPDTMTEVLLCVLRDTLRSEHITMNQMKTGMSIYDVVHSLKKMSFKGTKNKKVTFTKSDLPPGITVDHFRDIMVPFPGSIGLNQRLLEGHLVYLFTHQTIQEALTALYIAEMSIWKFRKFVSTKIHEKHWVVFRKILCGIILNPKTSNIAMEKEVDVSILKSDIDLGIKRSILVSSMKNQIRPDWFQRKIKGREAVRREDLLELMHALNESGEGVDNIIKSSIREIDFGHMTLTPNDKYTLASILARCSCLDLLDLLNVPLTSSDLALLASSMQRSNIKIKKFRFGGGILVSLLTESYSTSVFLT